MRFKLILCCFLPNISPYTKFHSNRKKNTEVENFRYWAVLVGRTGRSKNGCRYFKLILCCFWDIISPHTKIHPNRTENTEVKIFAIGRFWLVGLVGRKMVAATSNIRNLFRGLPMTSVPNLNQIGRKLAKLAHREKNRDLVGRAGLHGLNWLPNSDESVYFCSFL